MQPTRRPQLSHTSINQRVPSSALPPSFEVVLINNPREELEMCQQGPLMAARVVEAQVPGILSKPNRFQKQVNTLLSWSVAFIGPDNLLYPHQMEDLPHTYFAKV